jgi:class 3 adenylate cyclase/tetratricopeptide (TPR) repeat protein
MIDVRNWLVEHGFEQFADLFEENEIDGDVLFDLTNYDLKDLGLSLGARKKLLKAIAPASELEIQPKNEPPALAAATGERRQVTVLFADIADFTAMSERMGAEATHDVLNRYFEAADRIVEEFGGSIDKHIGDNVMAVFGAPVAHDNDPERAVRAALSIHEAAAGIMLPGGEALRLHIGIASGQVVASGTGSDSHREYTVIGDSVNLAARLEGLAEPGQTLVSEAVQRRTSGLFTMTSLDRQRLKGIRQPAPVWRIEGVAETIDHGRGTPFVGRRSELGQCRAIIEEVVATGEGQTILLRGAAGIGKTRLAEEVMAAAQVLDFSLHRCLVLDFGSRKNQDAIPALVSSLLGLPTSIDVDQRTRAADDGLSRGAYPAGDRVFVNDLLDLPQPLELNRLYNAMDDAARRAGRRSLIAGLAAWASRTGPQLILVEDLHWADPQTLDNLAAVMSMAIEHPIALLFSTRPEGDPLEGVWRAVGQDQPISIINLGALRASEAREMATGFAYANQERLAECLDRADGNPLFLEQLLQNVAESASDLVPSSIQSLVLARMDRLDLLDKQALQEASIFGQHFTLAGLRDLLDAPDYDCANLLKHQLVRPEGEDFLFAHALIRDGVYESILTAARSQLHLKAAQWYLDTDPALHAEHLHMAEDPRAARAYLSAALSEMAKYRHQQAIALLDKGKPLATEICDLVELALTLGEAQHDVGALEEAHAAFTEALEVADGEAARCRAWLGLAGGKRITDDLDGALADLDSAEAAARKLGLAGELSRVHYLRGNIAFPRADTETCLREHSAALDLARKAGSAELEAAALGGIADAEYLGGRYRSASERFTECVEISREHGFGRIQVANLPMMALTLMWCGEVERALDVGLEAVETARLVGHDRAEMVAHNAVFECSRYQGKIALARKHADQSLALSLQLGAERFEGLQMMNEAELDFIQGDQETALKTARDALASCRKTPMAFIGPTILGGVALVTDDKSERHQACAEAEALLAAGAVSHNYVYFRLFAIDASLRAGEFDEAERHADALAAFHPEEELHLIEFAADRGRALARVGRGDKSTELVTEIDRLIGAGEQMLLTLKVTVLHQARPVLLG